MAGAYPAWRRWQGWRSPNESCHGGGRAAHPSMMVRMTMATKIVPHHQQYMWPPTRLCFDSPFSYPWHFVARNTHRWIMAALQQWTRTADKTTSLRGLGRDTRDCNSPILTRAGISGCGCMERQSRMGMDGTGSRKNDYEKGNGLSPSFEGIRGF